MIRLLLFLLIFGTFAIGTFAQQATPTPSSTPVPQVTPSFSTAGRAVNLINNPQVDGRTKASPADGLALRQLIIQKYAQPLYRKPSELELESIEPDPEIKRQYKQFLARKNTGIFRLVADAGCSENAKVISASEACLKYTMPGSGNSFSFRTANYRIRHLSDLMLSAQNFYIPGILMHGMMTRLGDVPIDTVTLQTAGIDFLTEFKATSDYERAKAIEEVVLKGLERNGFVYARSYPVSENSTYAMRIIAYDGKVLRAVPGAHYDEMDFDRRRDMVVAFRVVNKDPEGGVTIVWVELSNVDSPKLKIPDDDQKAAN